MIDFRKLLVTLVIAVLFAIFVQTSIDAIVPPPEYENYCNVSTVGPELYKGYNQPVTTPEEQAKFDEFAKKQEACQSAFNDAMKKHEYVVFLVSAVAGLVATVVGMYIPVSTPVGMAVASGLILGGLFSLFVGTISGWGGIERVARPFIILVELIVVIFVAYKKLNTPLSGSKKS